MPVCTLTVTVNHYNYIVSLCKLQIQCPSLYSTNYVSVFTLTTTPVSLVVFWFIRDLTNTNQCILLTLGNRISWRMTLIMQEILIRLSCRSSCILFCFKCMLYGYCINAAVLYEIFSELHNAFSYWIKNGCVCACSLLQSDQLWGYVMARTSSILILFPRVNKMHWFVLVKSRINQNTLIFLVCCISSAF
jgi:hypothetical protein